jgi:AsmA protein
VRLALTGSASVPARDLDLKGTAGLVTTRDAPPTFELPFLVTGPWDNPLFWPDVQALIDRAGVGGSLLDAVRNRLKRHPGPATGSTPAPAVPAATPR